MADLTKYIESNALLAVQSGDEDGAQRQLAKLTDYELQELAAASYRLSQLCGLWRGAGVEL